MERFTEHMFTSFDRFYESEPPISVNCSELQELRPTDRIQIGYQLIAASLGIPINVAVFVKIVAALRRRYRRVLCLNLLLNISNLLVLITCTWYTLWLIEFWWTAGRLMCKLFAFLHTFVFYLYSNATISIAIEMLLAVRFPFFNYQHNRCLATLLVVLSIFLAFAASLPQLFLWDVEPVQCNDQAGDVCLQQCGSMLQQRGKLEMGFTIFHNLCVFWIPLAIIIPAYLVVSISVWRHYKGGEPTSAAEQKRSNSPTGIHISRAHSEIATLVVVEQNKIRRKSATIDNLQPIKFTISTTDEVSRDLSSSKTPSSAVYRTWSNVSNYISQDGAPLPGLKRISPTQLQLLKKKGLGLSKESVASRISSRFSFGSSVVSSNVSPNQGHDCLRQQNSNNGLRRNRFDGQFKSKRLRVIKSSLAIITVYIVSWLPYQLCSIWDMMGPSEHLNSDQAYDIKLYLECFEAVMIIGTVVNPFLYRFVHARRAKKSSTGTVHSNN